MTGRLTIGRTIFISMKFSASYSGFSAFSLHLDLQQSQFSFNRASGSLAPLQSKFIVLSFSFSLPPSHPLQVTVLKQINGWCLSDETTMQFALYWPILSANKSLRSSRATKIATRYHVGEGLFFNVANNLTVSSRLHSKSVLNSVSRLN